eukprot:356816-Chlamydomonas_euryale.AAC.1
MRPHGMSKEEKNRRPYSCFTAHAQLGVVQPHVGGRPGLLVEAGVATGISRHSTFQSSCRRSQPGRPYNTCTWLQKTHTRACNECHNCMVTQKCDHSNLFGEET